jgi:hypothetical protein
MTRSFTPPGAKRGQSLVIIALAFVALLAFVGLVIDVGSLYITYTQLKRAVDAAAVAAANNIKFPHASAAERKLRITEAAREMLAFHDITGVNEIIVYLCTDSGLPPDFDALCPAPGDPPRKLAYVEATHLSPVYFLRLFGVEAIPFSTSSVGEAATVDLVLVFDTSESMGSDRCDEAPSPDTDPPCTSGYDPRNFNPGACNAANNCYPLRNAKDAAKSLIANLFDGFDRVAIVTFDYDAAVQFNLNSNIGDDDGASDGDAFDAIDSLVFLHDDAPAALLPWTLPSPMGGYRKFNPINPDDRDGDGNDADPAIPCVDLTGPDGIPDLWDDNDGKPCDRDDIRDAYDWNENNIHDDDDIDPIGGTHEDTALLSTCTGCGIRMGANVLAGGGRPTSVWVMVFLSDGIANLSDTHATNPVIPAGFRYGFCGDDPGTSFWSSYCIDRNMNYPGGMNSTGRYCIDANPGECPPGTTSTSVSGPYSVEDYAFDMVYAAALLESANANEPTGEDIILYSIGLDAARAGADVLRYMANVGDEGSRLNDPCVGLPATQNCGNYYYAPTGAYLSQIFESIATRIFTKISR